MQDLTRCSISKTIPPVKPAGEKRTAGFFMLVRHGGLLFEVI